MRPPRMADSIWTTPATNARHGFERKWIRERADYELQMRAEMERGASAHNKQIDRVLHMLGMREDEPKEQKVVIQ